MIEVKNRSVESWGPLADCTDKQFNALVNGDYAKDRIKLFIKRKKKLKSYRVQFLKESHSDYFVLQAEDDYDLCSVARQFFNDNKDDIVFKEREHSKWAGGYAGYDRLSHVKLR